MSENKKTIYYVVISLVVLVGMYFLFDYLYDTKEKYSQEAYESYTTGNFNLAQEKYKKASKYWFLSSDENFYFAISDNFVSDYDDAIKRFEKSYKGKFNQYQSLVYSGNSYRQKGDYENAKNMYEKAIQMDPSEEIAYVNLIGIAENIEVDLEQFLNNAKTSVKDEKKLAKVYLASVVYFNNTDNQDSLIKYSDLLLEIDPENETAKMYIEKVENE